MINRLSYFNVKSTQLKNFRNETAIKIKQQECLATGFIMKVNTSLHNRRIIFVNVNIVCKLFVTWKLDLLSHNLSVLLVFRLTSLILIILEAHLCRNESLLQNFAIA